MTDPRALAAQIVKELDIYWSRDQWPTRAEDLVERVLRAHQDAQPKNLSGSVIAGSGLEGAAGKPPTADPRLPATSEHIEPLKMHLATCVQERDRLRVQVAALESMVAELRRL